MADEDCTTTGSWGPPASTKKTEGSALLAGKGYDDAPADKTG